MKGRLATVRVEAAARNRSPGAARDPMLRPTFPDYGVEVHMAQDGGWFQSRLGEAVAIVLSILVAFAIDAGWDELQDRNDEAELLADLRSEYESL